MLDEKIAVALRLSRRTIEQLEHADGPDWQRVIERMITELAPAMAQGRPWRHPERLAAREGRVAAR